MNGYQRVTTDEELEYQSLAQRNRRSRGGPDRNEAGQGVQSCIISPVGDEIASGGENTICIWDTNTGELLVCLSEDLDITVSIHLHQEVWSLDASDKFARVFDGISGTLLHHFQHDGLQIRFYSSGLYTATGHSLRLEFYLGRSVIPP